MEDQAAHNDSGKPSRINPNIRRTRKSDIQLDDYVSGILDGDRSLLSRAITLVESTRPEHQELAQQILEQCLEKSDTTSFRLGITGTPGVGKSTFIDSFGHYLVEHGRKLAVLTIDPSSQISRGSILGDKTRMEKLSQDTRAYIRPSAAGSSLGGVARKTRESILLCEAAGFDTIIVETVGVGQSETAVRQLVDFFLLLLQPGAGDELQGIKRGIVEMADLLAVNKSDGKAVDLARQAQRAYRNAIHLMAPKASGWAVEVVRCSALKQEGLSDIWQLMLDFCTFTQANGSWAENRRDQARHWLHQSLTEHLQQLFYQHSAVQQALPAVEQAVTDGQLSPFRAANNLIRLFIETKA
ncbi:methylmalonyl Co-A mutase-associated GTPase MeaB [Flavilitoribacter nigricans]|uniref:Methylmalonyl Co-A mutase-associated GTPase MeaB n=1 Tax=Flavilitoribacter nigricans (strain ATCC 23147 / DSM 23189 / NBRC 102662 / NCIMB 1420 / SS-2) TaxID=1122177 RepID=A0A2D0N7I5_FLAN2|nr:methylmalonyl Co-A mutase-associated GTPase MeaB [Flavilitoribacter nigricans]PHN04482.1 methylmalonyl Co-A mutase-associated GTPase MeaB [Flavilitoribacter nigricans DSM 23189 = NBRC 102662]